MPPARASARRAAGRRRVRGSNMRARFGSTAPGSNGGAPIPPSSRGGGRLSPGHGGSGGTVASRPLVDRARRRRPLGPRRRLGGRSPSGSRTGRGVVRLRLRIQAPAPLRTRPRAGDRSRVRWRTRARWRVRGRDGPDPRRRGAPVPGTPVRACAGLRTRAGSASSTCPTSCRTSCCRPSRGRTAGRRPRRSWWSRALPCAGRAASPRPVGGAHRTAAGGCPAARSCRRRPVASRCDGGASRMPAGSRRRAPRPPATASADRRIRAVRLVRPVPHRRVARRRPGSRGSAPAFAGRRSRGGAASRAGDTPA